MGRGQGHLDDAVSLEDLARIAAYSDLGETYAALMGQWLPRHGRAAGDPPSVECYLNNPANTKAKDLRTEVAIRLV